MAITANIFEYLKNGSILSTNSKNEEIQSIVYYLSDDSNFEENQYIFQKLGFQLVRENNCFYLTKETNLDDKEIEKFIKKYKDTFLSLSIVKQFFPAISSGSDLYKSDLIAKANHSPNNQVKQILEHLTKKEDNLSGSIETVLRILRDHKIIEQVDKKNEDKHFVLDAINYFNSKLKELENDDA